MADITSGDIRRVEGRRRVDRNMAVDRNWLEQLSALVNAYLDWRYGEECGSKTHDCSTPTESVAQDGPPLHTFVVEKLDVFGIWSPASLTTVLTSQLPRI